MARKGWFEVAREELRPGDKVQVQWESWDPSSQPTVYLREETVHDVWTVLGVQATGAEPVVYVKFPDGWHEYRQSAAGAWEDQGVLESTWRPPTAGVIVLASSADSTPIATEAAAAVARATGPVPTVPISTSGVTAP